MQYRFRGKRKDNNQWTYGSLVMDIDECRIYVYGAGMSHRVFSDTVGMWTGLKDRNGKDIYEGDLLKGFTASIPKYEVFYERYGFRLRYKLSNGDFYDWGPLYRIEEVFNESHPKREIEVIGNIHDVNPAGGQSSDNNMNILDPNAKAEGEVKEGAEAAEQNAQESAAQDAATGAGEDSQEGEGEQG